MAVVVSTGGALFREEEVGGRRACAEAGTKVWVERVRVQILVQVVLFELEARVPKRTRFGRVLKKNAL